MAIDSLLRAGALRTVFQPIVDLDTFNLDTFDTMHVVGYEALTRGPHGALTAPPALFAAARREGLLTELDDACRAAAVRVLLEQRLDHQLDHQLGRQPSPVAIFLNAEPEAFTRESGGARAWAELNAAIVATDPHLHIVLEITERDIPTRPATLLRTVEQARELGWWIALDDVGASPASLAFMPLLAPEVVKLDMALVQQRPSPATARIAHAVNDYAERSGALVLAEGVENPRHLATARALGARLGQGWLFGHPHEQLAKGPRTTGTSGTTRADGQGGADEQIGVGGKGDVGEGRTLRDLLPPPRVGRGSSSPTIKTATQAGHQAAPQAAPQAATPFTALSEEVVLRRAPKALLMQLSTQLEERAAQSGGTCILASAFQHARHFTSATAARYEQIAQHAGFVYAVGEAFSHVNVPGVHAASLPGEDPLREEWNVAVIGPHFHAALLARDLGDEGPDLERVFEYIVTYRYDTVVTAARNLLLRVSEQLPGPQ